MMSHSSEQAAIAAELDHQLAAYGAGLRVLLHGPWDPELYRQLSDLFDRMQMAASLLPKVSWTELLITRVELTHALWTLSTPSRINGKVVAFHARHQALISEVRRQCEEYLHARGEVPVSQF
jgi:hypothetical protein